MAPTAVPPGTAAARQGRTAVVRARTTEAPGATAGAPGPGGGPASDPPWARARTTTNPAAARTAADTAARPGWAESARRVRPVPAPRGGGRRSDVRHGAGRRSAGRCGERLRGGATRSRSPGSTATRTPAFRTPEARTTEDRAAVAGTWPVPAAAARTLPAGGQRPGRSRQAGRRGVPGAPPPARPLARPADRSTASRVPACRPARPDAVPGPTRRVDGGCPVRRMMIARAARTGMPLAGPAASHRRAGGIRQPSAGRRPKLGHRAGATSAAPARTRAPARHRHSTTSPPHRPRRRSAWCARGGACRYR